MGWHHQAMPRPDPMVVEPETLHGHLVRLEPLTEAHFEGLCEAGLVPDVFRWYLDPIEDREAMRRWMETALRGRESGLEEPFATIDRAGGRVLGSTRYMNIDRPNHRLEIGSTWLTPSLQGGGYNTEAKLLQLEHCFERLGCIRVEFKTDSLNERSRGALLGIGATFEGIFRDHMIRADGSHRHSAYYSVVADEWPRVKEHLRARLERQAGSTAPSPGAAASG
jgi:RimJ/RimL family protein N-acetyltransferase